MALQVIGKHIAVRLTVCGALRVGGNAIVSW